MPFAPSAKNSTWPVPPAALLLPMPPVQPYHCPFCEAEMLFEQSKNHYRCPDCKTIVALGHRLPDDESVDDQSEDTE